MMNSRGVIRAAMRLLQLAADIAVIECQIRSMWEKMVEVGENQSVARLLLSTGVDE
jgi:2-hydroxychromene-2-carboxylate isomerase